MSVSVGFNEPFRSIDLDETEEEVYGDRCVIKGWHFYNADATTVYVKFYNGTPSTVVVGTDTPVLTIPVINSWTVSENFPDGITGFPDGCTVAATTGVADSDTTGPGNNELVAVILYQPLQ